MASVSIYSNLKFIGYVQDEKAGKNGQYLRYNDGRATWNTVADDGVHRTVTVPSSEDVLIDKAGNVISYGLDESYFGIDTKPLFTTGSGGGGSVTFLGTQDEYNAQVWNEGDIFIPLSDGISISGNTVAIPAQLDIIFADNPSNPGDLDPPVEVGAFISLINIIDKASLAVDRFFTSESVSSFNFSVNKRSTDTNVDPVLVLSVTTFEVRLGTSVTTRSAAITQTVAILNALSTDPNNPTLVPRIGGGTQELTRNFVAIPSNDRIALLGLLPGSLQEPLRAGNATGISIEFLQAAGGSAVGLLFIKNTIYIRRAGNNGWLEYITSTQEIIEI